mgnify:CR=1 FL=1
MKLDTNQTYTTSSGWYTLQIDVPVGEVAVLKIKVPGAAEPAIKEFTESGVHSDFLGHCELTVENDNCELAISPTVAIKED